MNKMEKKFDPNIPDTSNGNFFCRLCLTEANSEHVWAIHIAGKRHYRNVIKYPNGLVLRQNDDNDQDSYEKPAKCGRYEENEWDGCPPEDYENELYTRRNYRPEIIDYDHRKGLSDVISPSVSKAFDGNCKKEKYENPIEQIFVDEKFELLKKLFEENISKAKTRETEQNTNNNSKVKPHIKNSEYEDDFEKELDELLKKSSAGPESEKDMFSKDKFKRKIDDLFDNKLSNRETKDKDLKLPSTVDCIKDSSNKRSNKTKFPYNSTSVTKSDDKYTKKVNQDSFKKKKKKNNDEEDFVDIFHKMNDEKLFEMSAADEDEDIFSVEKSSKTTDPKLNDFDPDSLTTDCVDNLLSSYLKPKSYSSKSKVSPESCTKNSTETNAKEDDLDTFSRKLESLPTKTFFQIILTRLKNLDLKDSEELKMLLGVISQAQEVVCNKLPPHLQAVIKSKMSQSNSKPTPVSKQHPVLPQMESVKTIPVVSQSVSKQALPTISGSPMKSVSKFLSQKEVKSVSHTVSSISSQSVQTPVSNTTSLIKSPSSSNSDSFQNMIAWQNYLTSIETSSEKLPLKSTNSVQATIAYQNYLSNLQTKALIASKMLPKSNKQNTELLNTCSNSKTSLSSSPNCSTTQTVSAEKLPNASNTVHSKDAIKNIFSLLQTAASKTVPQTSSSSLTKSTSAFDSSQSKSTSKNCKYVSKKDAQTVSSTAEIPNNSLSYPNQSVLHNYQTYYQQLYAMQLQRMTSSYANIGSSPSAFLAALSQNLAASQCNSSLPSNSQSDSSK